MTRQGVWGSVVWHPRPRRTHKKGLEEMQQSWKVLENASQILCTNPRFWGDLVGTGPNVPLKRFDYIWNVLVEVREQSSNHGKRKCLPSIFQARKGSEVPFKDREGPWELWEVLEKKYIKKSSGSIWSPEKSVVIPQLDNVTDVPGLTVLKYGPRFLKGLSTLFKAKTKHPGATLEISHE